jgi:mono/diheme cytochrome c family protein
MTDRTLEVIATAATVLVIGAAISLPFIYQGRAIHEGLPPGARVITLTGVAASGHWTEDAVNGENYWRRDFPAARPVLHVGETTAFRLASADVTHFFYSPELGLGPIEVYPGHIVEVVVTPKHAGVFRYYCTAFCGKPHFGMQGEIAVVAPGEPAPAARPSAPALADYWHAKAPPAGASIVERGKWIFHARGCVTCHGEGGAGGVSNFNYARGTVPALNGLSERLMLFDPGDVQSVVAALDHGVSLDSLSATTTIPRFAVVLAQYHAVEDIIRNGSVSAKLNPADPEPPLQMPTWGGRLSGREIDAVVAYLITLSPPGGA